jgi:hypothetical protein
MSSPHMCRPCNYVFFLVGMALQSRHRVVLVVPGSRLLAVNDLELASVQGNYL